MSDKRDNILTIDEVAAYLKGTKRSGYKLFSIRRLRRSSLGGYGHWVGQSVFSGLLLASAIPLVLRTRDAWND